MAATGGRPALQQTVRLRMLPQALRRQHKTLRLGDNRYLFTEFMGNFPADRRRSSRRREAQHLLPNSLLKYLGSKGMARQYFNKLLIGPHSTHIDSYRHL